MMVMKYLILCKIKYFDLFFKNHFFTMSLNKEKKPISERLDCLLLEILQSIQEYINKKEKYFEMYRDVCIIRL